MVSYEEFKKDFLEEIKSQAENEGWDSICCRAPGIGKNTWTWREVYNDLINETGTHGNLIRTNYKYKCEKK